MKFTFPPKKLQITYTLMGAGFGIVLSLLLYMMNYVSSSASIPFVSESFVWLLLLGVISFVWLISYVTIGALLPFVVSANEVNGPLLWWIAISPIIFYSALFWLLGSMFWAVHKRDERG